jgi:hypothetical protein
MARGLRKLVSNAAGAIGRVLSALDEIGQVILRKVDELLEWVAKLGRSCRGGRGTPGQVWGRGCRGIAVSWEAGGRYRP